MSYHSPLEQASMLLDEYRNLAYEKALAEVVTGETVVLDLGAGTGLLGLIAARLGARKVYLVEPETPLTVACEVARQNNLSDRIETLQSTIESAILPEKADVIISVFTGNFLLEEDLLPSLFHARDRYLAREGTLLPSAASMWMQPVMLPGLYQSKVDRWSQPVNDLKFDVFRQFACNRIYYDHFQAASFQALAAPGEVRSFDFYTEQTAECDAEVTFECEQPGYLHGYLGWFDMKLGENWLSTSPYENTTHWRQGFLPVEQPLPLKKGEQFEVRLRRRSHGEWHWTTRTSDVSFTQSTFLSEPVSVSTVRKKSADYQPRLKREGRLARLLLEKMDGELTSAELAEWLVDEFPESFPDLHSAIRFVSRQVDRFCD